MLDFKYAPEKMIQDYNEKKGSGRCTYKRTGDIVTLKHKRWNKHTGDADPDIEYDMSLISLQAAIDKLEADVAVMKAFKAEVNGD